MARPPNVLYLMSDQHAQKIAGCYGDGVVQTPHLDRLAARGVVFDNAYCPAPICVPSRMSALTARWPCEQACWTLEDQLASDLPTWPHALGAAGYRPALVGRLHAIGPDQRHGFAERAVGEPGPDWPGVRRQDLGVLAGAQGPAKVSLERSGPGQSGYQVVDMATAAEACRRLEAIAAGRREGDDAPFCLAVGFVLPHCPFVAWREDYDRYDGRVGPPALPRPDATREHPWLAAWRKQSGIEAPDPAAVIRARTAYYGLVTRLDRLVGDILETLEATGMADDTLVVYCSDHGEQLGERGLWWKNTFYEESVKVPLILAWPRALPAGERRAQVVDLIDLTATVIDAAGAPALPRGRGRSLLPIARDAGAPWQDSTISEYVTDAIPQWTGTEATQQRMLREGRYKLVYIHGYRPQLFDLAADPHELDDLGEDPGHAALRDDMQRRLLADWDPEAIAAEVAIRRREKDLLAEWARRIDPPSQSFYRIAAEDSWLDDLEVTA